ncbi:MAG: hypothetical protein J6V53_03450 [Alphaproteobacteria bacterium]|nr:hypothetical protein [Alphaproteobacteria bacterium]
MEKYTDDGDEIILSPKSLRLFDSFVRKNKTLSVDKDLQQSILNWVRQVIKEERKEWEELRKDTIDIFIKIKKSEEAKKGALKRDEKYVFFRNEFKKLQKEKYQEYLSQNKNLTANGFVNWFLKEKAKDYNIPYVVQNRKTKLIQLAQKNNRELKKLNSN